MNGCERSRLGECRDLAGLQKPGSGARSRPAVSDTAAPPPGRRERNKQEKLARIVGAARALFRDQGFTETTTQQIAEAADIGAGTLFLYARSKEDLLVMVFRDEMIETARRAIVDVLGAGLLAQFGDPQPRCKPLVLPP